MPKVEEQTEVAVLRKHAWSDDLSALSWIANGHRLCPRPTEPDWGEELPVPNHSATG
jgi:hypothetical protein